jgi:hypothetical protein
MGAQQSHTITQGTPGFPFPQSASTALASTAPPQPAPPVPVINTSLQRVPTQDGASGLHYSGRVYLNPMQNLATGVCDTAGSVSPDQIKDVMPGSISTTTLPIDNSTHRISQTALQNYVQGLIQAGKVPNALPAKNIDAQMTADAEFYTQVQTEYCFYESRYTASLDQFLQLAASPSSNESVVNSALTTTIDLNSRLNSLLEIVSYVANDRGQRVNDRSPKINDANNALQTNLGILRNQQQFLTSTDVRTRTQEEMVRFSAEKNRAMSIQIAFFVAINVVALGTVMTIYNSVPR